MSDSVMYRRDKTVQNSTAMHSIIRRLIFWNISYRYARIIHTHASTRKKRKRQEKQEKTRKEARKGKENCWWRHELRQLWYSRVPPWVCVLPGVFLSSRVTGACPVTTDLITQVNVRTTTTIRVLLCTILSVYSSFAFFIELYYSRFHFYMFLVRQLRQLWHMRVPPWVVCVFSPGYSSAPEWLEPVLWPRTWLCELMWEQQQQHSFGSR